MTAYIVKSSEAEESESQPQLRCHERGAQWQVNTISLSLALSFLYKFILNPLQRHTENNDDDYVDDGDNYNHL